MARKAIRGVGPAAIAGLVVVAAALGVVAVRTVMRTGEGEVTDESVAVQSRVGTAPGATAPALSAAPYQGTAPITLAQFRGHPVVLNFWASWCPPCRAEMPVLEAVYRKYRAQGVVVLGIDAATDTPDASRAFLAARGVTYPAGRDDRGQIARTYRINALPTTYFITADGRVADIALTGGFTGKDGAKELMHQIDALLRHPGGR